MSPHLSRVLIVRPDQRPLPGNACWWRLRLTESPAGRLYEMWNDQGGALHIDYWDGQEDWSFPYAARVYTKNYRDYYLDVLDVCPPSWPVNHGHGLYSGSRWFRLTKGPDWKPRSDFCDC